MCNKKSPSGHDDHVQRSSMIDDMIKKEEDDEEEDELIKNLAARKSRTKIRKPKFLSLRSHLISEDNGQSYRAPNKVRSTTAKTHHRQRRRSRRPQLNLFPLHPENRVENDFEDKGYMQQDENVALLFESDGSATLNGLLTSTATTSTMSSDLEEAESFSYYRGRDEYREETECDIVRTAMRSRERETSVEKWVCFSELVEGKREEDCLASSTTSTTGTRGGDDGRDVGHRRWSCGGKGLSLALKLDYEEILNAWSDKGPLYIDGGDSPQTVRDLMHQQDHQLFQLNDNSSTPDGSGGKLRRVPEEDGSLKMKMEQRLASVLRYKEKRHNRLYSKRIRYQVRKLNAEKRPRMKGRFVKRN